MVEILYVMYIKLKNDAFLQVSASSFIYPVRIKKALWFYAIKP